MYSRIALTGFVACFFISSAEGYGPPGHAMVGAIADQRLASKPVAIKIADLLDGITLERAAKLPDDIKAWDKGDFDAFHLPTHPEVEADLVAFVKANPVTDHIRQDHHTFHFTDVPLFKGVKYASGKIGRNDCDVVHVIPFCVKVLDGTESDNNAFKINKRIAVILLAHLVGDIHQPLHVGALYFDENGAVTNPDTKKKSFHTKGGGTLTLTLPRPDDHGHARARFSSLHSYWDGESVKFALDAVNKDIRANRKGTAKNPDIGDPDIAKRLAADEPAGWKINETGIKLSIAWADEILPAAQEAHDRLDITKITTQGLFANGHAEERLKGGANSSYDEFAGRTVRAALHKAGWRLADLLENAIK
jgi:hypothetical protein